MIVNLSTAKRFRSIRHYSSLYEGEENLSGTIKEVLNTLPEKWLWFNLNKGSIKSALFMSLFHTQGALNSQLAFEAVFAANKGDYAGLAFMSLLGKFVFPNASNWGDLFSKAVSADGELVYDYNNQFTPENALLGAPISKLHWSAVDSWPMDPIEQEYRQLQYSDIDTLLISGNIDVSTPSVFAQEELLPYLNKGHHLILKEFGHVGDFYTLQPEAAKKLLSTYFNEGIIERDLFEYSTYSFETGMTFGRVMKYITIAFIVFPILISLLLLLAVKKIRKKKALLDT